MTFADRTLRFVAVSLLFHLLLAWPEYLVFRLALVDLAPRQVLLSGEFALLWFGILVLVAVPAGCGATLGGLYSTRTGREGWQWIRCHVSAERETQLLRLLLGRGPAPRAWDQLFGESPAVYLRGRTPDGAVFAGRFADASYAGGFPHSADLLLEEAFTVDPETGALGEPLGYAVYVTADQVGYLEIISEADSNDPQGRPAALATTGDGPPQSDPPLNIGATQ